MIIESYPAFFAGAETVGFSIRPVVNSGEKD
jgi:hypothetical protein